ncbi:MAG: hypothetical protein ACTSQJ_11890 [Promethearchaeota archaeon]
MTSKRYFSNKRTTHQTISISPALKDWILRYVNKMKKKYPNDIKYKSISSFYNYVMEKVLNIFEKGKTLEDFEKIPDNSVEDFYDQITFKAVIPHFESSLELNKFNIADFESTPRLYLRFFDYVILKEKLDKDNAVLIIERFKNFMVKNRITKDFKLTVVEDKFIVEYCGNYKNLHFDVTKGIAGIFGILGLKITNFFYSEKDIYSRFDLLDTRMVYSRELDIKERKKLYFENMNKIINYFNILKDKDEHFWIKLSRDQSAYINFKDDIKFVKWFKKIEEDIQNFGNREEKLQSLLNFFEKLHWIKIISKNDLSFQILLDSENNKREINLMKENLSNYCEINKNRGIFYLE